MSPTLADVRRGEGCVPSTSANHRISRAPCGFSIPRFYPRQRAIDVAPPASAALPLFARCLFTATSPTLSSRSGVGSNINLGSALCSALTERRSESVWIFASPAVHRTLRSAAPPLTPLSRREAVSNLAAPRIPLAAASSKAATAPTLVPSPARVRPELVTACATTPRCARHFESSPLPRHAPKLHCPRLENINLLSSSSSLLTEVPM